MTVPAAAAFFCVIMSSVTVQTWFRNDEALTSSPSSSNLSPVEPLRHVGQTTLTDWVSISQVTELIRSAADVFMSNTTVYILMCCICPCLRKLEMFWLQSVKWNQVLENCNLLVYKADNVWSEVMKVFVTKAENLISAHEPYVWVSGECWMRSWVRLQPAPRTLLNSETSAELMRFQSKLRREHGADSCDWSSCVCVVCIFILSVLKIWPCT